MPSAKVKRERKAKTSEVRERVMKRAGGFCEACGRWPWLGLELDHHRGGSRRHSDERLETCWGICRPCHRDRTDNRPSSAHWWDRIASHCRKHGYTEEAEYAEARAQ